MSDALCDGSDGRWSDEYNRQPELFGHTDVCILKIIVNWCFGNRLYKILGIKLTFDLFIVKKQLGELGLAKQFGHSAHNIESIRRFILVFKYIIYKIKFEINAFKFVRIYLCTI